MCPTSRARGACWRRRDAFYRQFATHNAHTIADHPRAAPARAREFEFQRLHGMGEDLYDEVLGRPADACRVYAPVGSHEDLLALSRAPPARERRQHLVRQPHRRPRDRHRGGDRRSRGARCRPGAGGRPEDPAARGALRRPAQFGRARLRRRVRLDAAARRARAAAAAQDLQAAPIVSGAGATAGPAREARDPAERARHRTRRGSATPRWRARRSRPRAVRRSPPAQRARGDPGARGRPDRGRARAAAGAARARGRQDARRRAGRSARGGGLLPLLRARRAARFRASGGLPGPTGESNRLFLAGRGPFVCISPWNFPLAIFVGQIAAASAAGNAVVAKPAEQTPLVACRAVALLHEAGVAREALGLRPGPRRDGGRGRWSRDARIAGVCFTGSTATAHAIHRAPRRARRPHRALHRRDRGPERDARRFERAARASGRRCRSPRPSTAPGSAARRCACCACRRRSRRA